MFGLDAIKKIVSLYDTVDAFKGAFGLAVNAPSVFMNGVVSGMLANSQQAEQIVFDHKALLEAEEKTEVALADVALEHADSMIEDFNKVHRSREDWHQELDQAIRTKSVGDMIGARDIDPSRNDVVLAAAKSIEKMYSGQSVGAAPASSPKSAGTATAAVFLKSVSAFGTFIGSKVQEILPESMQPTQSDKDAILLIAVMCNMPQELAKEALALPQDLFWAAIGGALEGSGKTLVSLIKDKEGKKTPEDEVAYNRLKEKISNACEEFSKVKAGVMGNIRMFDNPSLDDAYIRNASAAKCDGLLIRKEIIETGNYSRAALDLSDEARATARGARLYASSVVAEGARLLAAGATRLGANIVKQGASMLSPAELEEKRKKVREPKRKPKKRTGKSR